MTQSTLIIPTTGVLSGLALVQAVNGALGNVSSNASGATDPSTLPGGVQQYSFWTDTSVSPALLRMRNGANNGWLLIGDASQAALGHATQVGFQQNLYAAASAAGSADALTASFSPAITNTTISAGSVTLTVRAANANVTTTPTFTPNSGTVTAATIVKGAGTALLPGDIAGAGHWLTLQWDITLAKWVLLNPASGVVTSSRVGEVFDWPVGAIMPSYGIFCNGASGISSSTFAALFNVLVKSVSGATMTIAAPAVITWTGHGLYVNAPVKFTTTGALPTGIVSGTTYYVITAGFGTNSFQVSATIGGSAVTTTGTQSGVHTAIHAPYGCANDLSTFSVPNIPTGYTTSQSNDNEGITTAGTMPLHNHVINISDPGHAHSTNALLIINSSGGASGGNPATYTPATVSANTTGITATSNNAGSGSNNLAASVAMGKYIRFV